MVTPKNRISRMLTETSSRVLNERGCIVLGGQPQAAALSRCRAKR
jgi:hypothetical protein